MTFKKKLWSLIPLKLLWNAFPGIGYEANLTESMYDLNSRNQYVKNLTALLYGSFFLQKITQFLFKGSKKWSQMIFKYSYKYWLN